MAGAQPLARRGALHVVLLLSQPADMAATGRAMTWRKITAALLIASDMGSVNYYLPSGKQT